jgi:hypothetical protein
MTKFMPIGTPNTCIFCGATKKRYCKHRIKWYQNYEIMSELEDLGFGLLMLGLIIGEIYFLK